MAGEEVAPPNLDDSSDAARAIHSEVLPAAADQPNGAAEQGNGVAVRARDPMEKLKIHLTLDNGVIKIAGAKAPASFLYKSGAKRAQAGRLLQWGRFFFLLYFFLFYRVYIFIYKL